MSAWQRPGPTPGRMSTLTSGDAAGSPAYASARHPHVLMQEILVSPVKQIAACEAVRAGPTHKRRSLTMKTRTLGRELEASALTSPHAIQ